MSETAETFDAIIIGAGQAGVPLAHEFAAAGWKTALVERGFVGGTCINYGCTPTKTMIASAKMAHLARRAGDFGVHVGDVNVDLAQVIERKNSVVQSFRQPNRRSLEEADNLELIQGQARFTDSSTIAVDLSVNSDERLLSGGKIIVNSGGRPRRPDLPGLDGVEALDSTSIMQIDELPQHLLVLGGGYVGLEFGQMFRRFGAEVTIVQRSSQLLTREDRDIADEITAILRDEGIKVHLQAEATSVEQTPDGKIKLSLDSFEGPAFVTGSHLLLAAGRVPNTEDLHVEAAGLELDGRGNIKVDHQLRTNVEGIYAVGDVKGGPAFTHISYDDFRVLAANVLESANRSIKNRPVPYTVYTDPQLGRVGLTEKQADQSGVNYKVGRIPMSSVARAIEVGETQGLLKAIVDEDTDQILGVAFLGLEGGELMSAVQLAMKAELPYTALRDGIFAHPTLAEAFNTLFGSLA